MSESDIAVSPESESGATVGVIGSRNTREFIRYFAASLVALAVDAGSLALMTSVFGVPYLISGGIAFTLGLITVYFLSVRWVFEVRHMRSVWAEFGIFLVVGLVGLGINEGVLWVLTGAFGLFYLVSKIASVLIVFTWNFFARKALLF